MDKAEKLSVTVTPAMARKIRDWVDAGTYASASEVVRAGMRALQRDEDEHAERLAAIRARIKAAAEETGPGYSSTEVFSEIRSRLKARAAGGFHEDPAGSLE